MFDNPRRGGADATSEVRARRLANVTLGIAAGFAGFSLLLLLLNYLSGGRIVTPVLRGAALGELSAALVIALVGLWLRWRSWRSAL
jgi:hypothetical protein